MRKKINAPLRKLYTNYDNPLDEVTVYGQRPILPVNMLPEVTVYPKVIRS